MLPVAVALWERGKDAAPFQLLRRHRALTAFALVGGAALICTKKATAALASDALQKPGKLAAAIVMIYFALELHEWQIRKRNAARS